MSQMEHQYTNARAVKVTHHQDVQTAVTVIEGLPFGMFFLFSLTFHLLTRH